MTAKRTSGFKITADATAKAKVGVKASYSKNASEVIPPDVTRAKSARWAELLSPATELAGLMGDRIRFQRLQLRIQQTAVLEKLLAAFRRKIRADEIKQPIPPKLLIPALEAASLEQADSPLIDWWADLLVTSVKGGNVRPYFVDLMTKIGPNEAQYLECLWKALVRQFEAIPEAAVAVLLERIETAARFAFLYKDPSPNFFKETVSSVVRAATNLGVPVQVYHPVETASGEAYMEHAPPHLIDEKARGTAEIAISLGLLEIKRNDLSVVIPTVGGKRAWAAALVFTKLGVDFMSACRPPEMSRLS